VRVDRVVSVSSALTATVVAGDNCNPFSADNRVIFVDCGLSSTYFRDITTTNTIKSTSRKSEIRGRPEVKFSAVPVFSFSISKNKTIYCASAAVVAGNIEHLLLTMMMMMNTSCQYYAEM